VKVACTVWSRGKDRDNIKFLPIAIEPRCLSALCKDPGMIGAYNSGKDLYVEIAAIAFHKAYKYCLEHFPKGCPIKQTEDGNWVYALLKTGEDDGKLNFEDLDYSDINPDDYDYDKLADGETDVYKEGKELRGQSKKILLGIMYGRGEKSIAEQLGCEIEEARTIKDNVYKAFPGIKVFEEASNEMVRKYGFVTTLWGRHRRLPNYNLPRYEFFYCDAKGNIIENMNVPDGIKASLSEKMSKLNFKDRETFVGTIKEKEQIIIKDNGSLIAAAQRQIINSRVQGSSADMSKKALIKINTDEELIKRGVKPIIPVHDEVLIETPLRYAKYAKHRFAYDMEEAPQPELGIQMKCDVVTSCRWYGDELNLDEILGDLEDI